MRRRQAVPIFPAQCRLAQTLILMVLAMLPVANHAVAQPPDTPPAETLTFPDELPATWLTYHLAHPGTNAPGDPNGAFFWNGRYHLHYIYEGPAGASWAHVSSPDMVHWKWHPTTLTPKTMGHALFNGRLLHDQIPPLDVPRDEDISCPNMFRIGDNWMLLCLSHWIGSRYYLGDFRNEQFLPDSHGRMNWMCDFKGGDEDADVFAPESLLTPDGRRVMWAWARVKQRLKDVSVQSSIQCLPRELSLLDDGVLRIKPLRELEQLRGAEYKADSMTIAANSHHCMPELAGDTLELRIVFEPGSAHRFGVQVY